MLLVVLMCLGMACDCLAEDVQVTTRLGIVRGRRVSTEPSGSVDMFLGIPYAQPPVGESSLLLSPQHHLTPPQNCDLTR